MFANVAAYGIARTSPRYARQLPDIGEGEPGNATLAEAIIDALEDVDRSWAEVKERDLLEGLAELFPEGDQGVRDATPCVGAPGAGANRRVVAFARRGRGAR